MAKCQAYTEDLAGILATMMDPLGRRDRIGWSSRPSCTGWTGRAPVEAKGLGTRNLKHIEVRGAPIERALCRFRA